MDKSKIEKYLPGCKISEIRPCTTEGKIQIHLKVKPGENVPQKVLDINKLIVLMQELKPFQNLKYSKELGVVKANYGRAEISILASGRIVLKEVADESEAQNILEVLAPILSKSLITRQEHTPDFSPGTVDPVL
jgi:ArsR family metal-binding transcriptional regulator